MKQLKRLFITLTFFVAAFAVTSPVQAASQSECAIWLCLPGGFPSGCGDAKSSMRHRVRNGKPPLPDFSSCAVNAPEGSGSHMSYRYGVSAFIPARQVCTRWGDRGDGVYCQSVRHEAARRVKGTRCETHHESGINYPLGCTGTDRWAEVYLEGQKLGNTHYY